MSDTNMDFKNSYVTTPESFTAEIPWMIYDLYDTNIEKYQYQTLTFDVSTENKARVTDELISETEGGAIVRRHNIPCCCPSVS